MRRVLLADIDWEVKAQDSNLVSAQSHASHVTRFTRHTCHVTHASREWRQVTAGTCSVGGKTSCCGAMLSVSDALLQPLSRDFEDVHEAAHVVKRVVPAQI